MDCQWSKQGGELVRARTSSVASLGDDMLAAHGHVYRLHPTP
jgi:hypothetical protein